MPYVWYFATQCCNDYHIHYINISISMYYIHSLLYKHIYVLIYIIYIVFLHIQGHLYLEFLKEEFLGQRVCEVCTF